MYAVHFPDREDLREALRLVSASSHDLKSPLAGMLGLLQALRLRWRGMTEEQRDDALEAMMGQIDLLTRRVDNLVAAARLELPPALVELDLRAAAESAAREARLLSRRPVVLEPAPAPARVVADRDRLDRVLANLIDNAVKYSSDRVRIRVGASRRFAWVAIDDRGIGIAPEDVGRIFEPFTRLHDAAGGTTGIGLGLFLARSFVQDMGGRIDVASIPDHGSTFIVRLPAAPPVPGRAPARVREKV